MRMRAFIASVYVGTVSLTPLTAHAFLDALLTAVKQAVPAAGQTTLSNAAALTTAPKDALNQAALALECAKKGGKEAACAQVAKIKLSRPPEQLDKLFNGTPITGDALMSEVKLLRTAVASHSLNTAMASMLGPMATLGQSQVPVAANSFFSGNFLGSLASSATDVLLDMLTAELSYAALDVFFTTMTDQPGLLKEVEVTLPVADATMLPEMKQQLVTMASFLIAIKASGKIIDASEKDFDAANESYRKVLDSRSKTTALLGDAFYARSGLFASEKEGRARGQTYLNAADLAYLETFRDKKPEEFMRDFNAQNIALDYLRKAKPAEYADYRVNIDEFKSHYGAYTRTTLGATSMLAFSTLFLKRTKSIVEKYGLLAAPALLPLVGDGLKEVMTLAPRVQKTIERAPDTQNGSFFVKPTGGETQHELAASKVFASLNDEGRASFQSALFKSGDAGYFGQLGEKYPLVAGQILDALVEKGNRKVFVKGYLQEDDLPDFSFQNELGGNARKTRELKAALFRSAPGEEARAEDEKAIALVQKDVRDKLGKWDNSTLRRIVFANRDTSKREIEFPISGATIGIDSPGMKGIMEYEEMASVGATHATVAQPANDKASATADAKSKNAAGSGQAKSKNSVKK